MGRDRAAEGTLKDLITAPKHRIEFKGKESFEVDNYIRLLVTSNAEWVVPAAFDERRFAVFDVGTAHQQDRRYFGALWRELTEQGGAAALLDYLLHYPLADLDLGVIPETRALQEQKVHHLDPEAAWLLDVLRAGVLPGDSTGSGRCPKAVLHDAYVAHAKQVGVPRRSTETQLGIFLRRMLRTPADVPLVKTARPDTGEGRELVYVFRALTDCRAAFAHALRSDLTWDDPAVWTPWTDRRVPPVAKEPWQ